MSKVLLVADADTGYRELYRRTLENAGYRVRAAADAGAALALAEFDPPDLAVIDLLVPPRGGFELMRELVTRLPEVRVILTSPFGFFDAGFESWSADGWVVKSPDPEALLRTVAEVLGAPEPSVA